ncbi:unnamed protein product [Rangifer tarandus platyrhynchus]|uniref:Uncharacterized protein n=2 Tax=Rangifer tarandus platyrhynchus TaxID=3082113 RepID=A0ABN8Z7C6_RANTA|nr:unnamed protein product [Rangifer tarandus platyrhynchus]
MELMPLMSAALEAGSFTTSATMPASVSCSVVSDSLRPHGLVHQAPQSMEFPGKNTGVDCHSFLQGVFLIQGSDSLPSEPPGKSIQNIQKFEIISNILLRPPSFLISSS